MGSNSKSPWQVCAQLKREDSNPYTDQLVHIAAISWLPIAVISLLPLPAIHGLPSTQDMGVMSQFLYTSNTRALVRIPTAPTQYRLTLDRESSNPYSE